MSSIVTTRFSFQAPAFPRTMDPAAVRAFDQITKFMSILATHPLLDGVLIQNVPLPNAVNYTIEHHLGRAWRGWFETNRIVNNSTSNTIREGTSGLDKRYFLELNATNPLTVDLWVF